MDQRQTSIGLMSRVSRVMGRYRTGIPVYIASNVLVYE